MCVSTLQPQRSHIYTDGCSHARNTNTAPKSVAHLIAQAHLKGRKIVQTKHEIIKIAYGYMPWSVCAIGEQATLSLGLTIDNF